MLYPEDYPSTNIAFREVKDTAMQSAFRSLLSVLEQLRARAAAVINANAVRVVSQNTQPTVEDGRLVVWNDADAASGQPSHYLIFQDGATTVRWVGDHLVP